MLLCLPALGGGLSLDDYFHLSVFQGWSPSFMRGAPLLDLFNFLPADAAGRQELIDMGVIPWWASPDLRGSFLRPLSAATHLLDHALWPDSLVLQHLHSLLWFGLAVALVGLLYREVGGAVLAASGLAALLFAVEDAHAVPAVWLANRNAVLSLVFGAVALLWHVRWRRRGGAGRLAGSLLATLLALLSAEAALAAVGYMAAYQLTLDRGRLARRLMALLPVTALVLAWRIIYGALGHGTGGMDLYLDPGVDPAGFLVGLLERWPVLLLTLWSQLNVDVWVALPRSAQLGVAAAGALTAAGLWLLVRPLLARSAEARFWLLGMVLAGVPACAGFPMVRLTLFMGIGAFGLLACLARDLGLLGGDRPSSARPWRPRAAKLLLVIHLPLAAALLLFGTFVVPAATRFVDRIALRSADASPTVRQRSLVLVNGYDMLTMYIPTIRRIHGLPVPRRTNQLASLSADLTVTRPGPRALSVAARGGFFQRHIDRLFWSRRYPLHAGAEVTRPDFTARVDRATPDGRPLQVTYEFRVPLEDPSLIWRAMVDGRVVPFSPPPVGGSASLPSTLPSLLPE